MSYIRFLIWSSSCPIPWSRIIYAILKEGIMGNIHVNSAASGEIAEEEKVFEKKDRVS